MTAQTVQDALDFATPANTTTETGTAVTARPSTRERLQESAGTRDASNLPHTCRCGARWSGTRTAHCAAKDCHQTFTGITAFDAHRPSGECVKPATVGLALVAGRAYDCWGTTETDGSDDQ